MNDININYRILENGLEIYLEDEESKKELEELSKQEDFQSNKVMFDVMENFMEYVLTNTSYRFGTADELNQLSEAPCIADFDLEDNGNIGEIYELYYFDKYMIVSIQELLLRDGKVFFSKA